MLGNSDFKIKSFMKVDTMYLQLWILKNMKVNVDRITIDGQQRAWNPIDLQHILNFIAYGDKQFDNLKYEN